MRTWRHPFHRLKFKVYMSSAGAVDEDKADAQVVDRLVTSRGPYSRARQTSTARLSTNIIAAMARSISRRLSFTFLTNMSLNLPQRHPELFVPNISVNPYRPDAITELEKWAKRGARVVKWLPNAMGIDPSDPKCDPFYQKMKELDLILLSHGGEEKAVEAEEDQKLGNPLLLRRALDHGVKVIVAHCAGLGTNEDLDSKDREQRAQFRSVSAFDG